MFGILEKQAATMCSTPATEAMSAQQFMTPNKINTCKAASKLTHQQQSKLV
jgi:hypothetical protein